MYKNWEGYYKNRVKDAKHEKNMTFRGFTVANVNITSKCSDLGQNIFSGLLAKFRSKNLFPFQKSRPKY